MRWPHENCIMENTLSKNCFIKVGTLSKTAFLSLGLVIVVQGIILLQSPASFVSHKSDMIIETLQYTIEWKNLQIDSTCNCIGSLAGEEWDQELKTMSMLGLKLYLRGSPGELWRMLPIVLHLWMEITVGIPQ